MPRRLPIKASTPHLLTTPGAVTAPENQTAVTTVTANRSAVFSISGGVDAAFFSIDDATGVLTFKAAPDYENKLDANHDGVYEIGITATAGALTDTRNLSITVLDVEEAPYMLSAELNLDGRSVPETGWPVEVTIFHVGDQDASGGVGGGTYQWYRGAAAINGATSSSYTPVTGDVGTELFVGITPTSTVEPSPGTEVKYSAGVVARCCYFDDTNGVNAHGGMSPGDAFQTILKLTTLQSSLNPGERARLKRGETFDDVRWDFPASAVAGTAGAHIIFADYGTGAKPLINSSLGARVDAGGYYEFRNLDVRAWGAGNSIDLKVSHLYMYDCDATGNASQNNGAIHVGNIAADIEDFLIHGCTAHGSNYYGVHVYDVTYHVDDCIVEYGTFYTNGSATAASFHGIYFGTGARNCIARFNECYGNSGAGIKSNASMADSGERNYIYNNYCHDNKNYGIYLGGVNDWVDCYNNVCWANTTGSNDGASLYLHTGAVCNIYHNTLVNGGGMGVRWNDASMAGNVFKNNIVVQDSAVVGSAKNPLSLAGDGTGVADGNTFDYNEYWYDAADIVKFTSGGTASLATWRGYADSPDAHTLNSDPVFVTEYTNLDIQTSSPCKNAGVDVGITTDFTGGTRDATPDIGAYEYGV